MMHPYLKSGGRLALYILIWGVVSVAIGLVSVLPTGVPWRAAFDFGSIFGLLFGALAIPLWSVTLYGNRLKANNLVRAIGNVVVAAAMLVCWLGLGAAMVWMLMPPGSLAAFLPCAPQLALTGVLLHILVVQRYNRIIAAMQNEEIEPPYEPETESGETEPAGEILERIAVKTGQKIEITPVSEIEYIQAEGDYVMICTSSGRFLKEQTMKYFEQHLPQGQFVRIHRSYIVNMKAISRIERYDKQEQLVVLHGGKKIRASTNGYRQLKKVLKL